MISPKDIKALAKAMRSEGIVSLKTPEVEILLNPAAPSKRKYIKRSLEDDSDTLVNKPYGGYTDEEILLWSAPQSEPEPEPDV